MTHSVLIGSGSSIPPRCITNAMLATIMETNDEWVRERTGVETRYFVEKDSSTLELSIPAAERAMESAGVSAEDIDLVVYATMTPDHYFPGNGGLLQARLGLRTVPCFDVRQQCSGFLYALQLADMQIRAGAARTVLVVGAEVHSAFFPFGEASWARLDGAVDTPIPQEEWDLLTKNRHLAVLFGDGAAAVVVQARDDGDRGIIDHILCADGRHYERLCVPGVGTASRPYVSHEMVDKSEHLPSMDGRFVFKMATTRMAEAAQTILKRNGVAPEELAMVLMHQANLRINEYVQKMLGLPDSKVIHNIMKYGNTTAATIPLLWDESVRTGRIKPGDLVLCVGFGAGMTWGANLIRA